MPLLAGLDRVQLLRGRGDRAPRRQARRARVRPPVRRGRRQSRRARLLQVRGLPGRQRRRAPRRRHAHGGDRAAARHLVLHVHADRVPGRRLPRSRALRRRSLRALRQLLSAPDRGTDPASPRDDAAVRGADELSARLREPRRGPHALRHRPVQEDGARRRHRAVREPGLRPRRGRLCARASWRRGAPPSPSGCSSISISPPIPTWRSGCRRCSASRCRSTSNRRTRRRASSNSGAAGT